MVASAREFADRIKASLPQSVDVAALGVRSKAPFQLLCTREALIWRTEELARNACDAMDRDDLAVAAILTRSITENAALLWRLMEILEARSEYSPQQLNDLLMRALVGSKKWDDFPNPFNALDCLDRLDKKVKLVRNGYDSLSEIAHPNWNGVLALYSNFDKENFIARFGRGLRENLKTKDSIEDLLLGSLGIFEYAYNRISDEILRFITELDSIFSSTD